MRCTNNKIKLLALFGTAVLLVGGCGAKEKIPNAYQPYSAEFYQSSTAGETGLFTSDLCVTDDTDIGTDKVSDKPAEAAGVFNLKTKEVRYSQNVFERLYPASTTKILTAYIIIKNENLDEMVTVSENAVNQAADSSVCGLKAGDYLSVRDLLYGLLLDSGNDAALALAEHYSGSEKKFVKVMNQTAKELGATGSHFTNPHGLPDEKHYTTVYDMYLIFSRAVKLDTFVQIISTDKYEAAYRNGATAEDPEGGAAVSQTWSNTNRYLTGDATAPEGIEVAGGKTGTTNAAGYCLALYSYNAKKEPIISIVFKAGGQADLYSYMSELLEKFGQ